MLRDRPGDAGSTATSTTGAPRCACSRPTARTASSRSRATSLVEVDASRRPAADRDLELGRACATADVRDEFGEFLAQTAGRPSRRPSWPSSPSRSRPTTPPAEAALAISDAVHDAMTYVPASTGVHTLAAEAWAGAQRRVPGLRPPRRRRAAPRRHAGPLRLGLPAPDAEPVIGETGAGESHAWVEWWLGEWVDHDPTNLRRRRRAARHGRRGPRLRATCRRSRASSPGRTAPTGLDRHGRAHPPGVTRRSRDAVTRLRAPACG